MRRISAAMEKRLNNRIQTASTGAAPSTDLWISRPTTALTQAQFLERQTVTATGSSDLSIAVCHPRFGASNNRIYLAYIQGGVAKVSTSRTYVRMDAHIWVDAGFEEPAQAVSIAFDGRMPKNRAGQIEFLTDAKPWVFWVNSGALYARKLGTEATVTLAESGCTDVSAVRAMWSEVGSFDFGLCVFFLLNGTIYYRQLIGGEWMDAAPVSFGPDGVTWTEIAAQRTWDYRVALQAKASDGTAYELFTQFMGIGKQNTEHIEVRNVKAQSKLTEIRYHSTQATEHITLDTITAGALYGGLYSTAVPSVVSVYNVDDGEGDWGHKLIVELDVHLRRETVSTNAGAFTIVDSYGATFMASTAELDGTGKQINLTFADFNAASGGCRLIYTPGTVLSMADVSADQMQFAFTPENLNPPEIGAPEPVEIWNLDDEGTEIAIRFSEAITGDVSGNEDKFVVTTQEYDMVPGGVLSERAKTVLGVALQADDNHILVLSFAPGNTTSIQNAVGDVAVSYGGGSLMGIGGAVEPFEMSFVPEGLAPKNNPNMAEHVDLVGVSGVGSLIEIYYANTQATEHIGLTGAYATGVLVHVDDI